MYYKKDEPLLHLILFLSVIFHLDLISVRKHQANSHTKKGWEQFTDSVIRTVSQKKNGVVFLLWGNFAQEKSR